MHLILGRGSYTWFTPEIMEITGRGLLAVGSHHMALHLRRGREWQLLSKEAGVDYTLRKAEFPAWPHLHCTYVCYWNGT